MVDVRRKYPPTDFRIDLSMNLKVRNIVDISYCNCKQGYTSYVIIIKHAGEAPTSMIEGANIVRMKGDLRN